VSRDFLRYIELGWQIIRCFGRNHENIALSEIFIMKLSVATGQFIMAETTNYFDIF